MRCIRPLLCLLLAAVGGPLAGQSYGFTVQAGAYQRQGTTVCTRVADSIWAQRSSLSLVELSEGRREVTDAQWADGKICFALAGTTAANSQRVYELVLDSPQGTAPALRAQTSPAGAMLTNGDRQLLHYRVAPASLPPGVDPIYARGNFIHPLITPAGDTLTRIQPPDHYHHYGIWNPWTRVEWNGREYDFWNLIRGHGTVVSEGPPIVTSGSVYSGLTAHSAYLAFRDSAVRQPHDRVLAETTDLRLWPAGDDRYLVDYRSRQTNVTEQPFVVKAYRYQGFGFRARADWNDDNTTLLTSEGLDKADGNATRARWIDVNGPTVSGRAGILFMAHPDNFNSPEQLRIWPTGANEGRENVFVNFNPAQDRDYPLRPGGTYELKYRLLVYDGLIDTATAERQWRDFAHPPRVQWQRGTDRPLVLVYTRNGEGFVHDNIPASIAAIERLGRENGFDVDSTDDPGSFTPTNLAKYDALVFSNTNNDVFATPEQEAAFKAYMTAGGAFVGIHSACGSERDWPWFWRNLGGKFHRHANRQDFDVAVVDPDHPSTRDLPSTWHVRDDECYYLRQLNPGIRVLLAADLRTVTDSVGRADYPADTFGNSFPTSWYHHTDGGHQWYTSLGHRIEHYSDPLFLRHILGGIQWAIEQ